MCTITVVISDATLYEEKGLGLAGGPKIHLTFASYPLSRSCSAGIFWGFILENRSFAFRGVLPLPFFWIFLTFAETCTSSVGCVDTAAVTTAAPDSDVFRFFVTCISSLGIDVTPVLALDLEDATPRPTGILPEMGVISASDSDSELEVVDSESDDVDSESEELESELEELESELELESDELTSFFGVPLRASFLSDAESVVESSESESDPELELPLTEGFFLVTLDFTSGTLASLTNQY